MKTLTGLERPQTGCECQLCRTIRAHSESLEFDLSDTLPDMPRVPKTVEEWKQAFKEAGL